MSNEEFSSRFLFFAQYTHSQTKNKRPRPSTPMGWRWQNNCCTSARGSIFTLMERIFLNEIFPNSNNIPRNNFTWLAIGQPSPPISPRRVWKVMLMLIVSLRGNENYFLPDIFWELVKHWLSPRLYRRQKSTFDLEQLVCHGFLDNMQSLEKTFISTGSSLATWQMRSFREEKGCVPDRIAYKEWLLWQVLLCWSASVDFSSHRTFTMV